MQKTRTHAFSLRNLLTGGFCLAAICTFAIENSCYGSANGDLQAEALHGGGIPIEAAL